MCCSKQALLYYSFMTLSLCKCLCVCVHLNGDLSLTTEFQTHPEGKDPGKQASKMCVVAVCVCAKEVELK